MWTSPDIKRRAQLAAQKASKDREKKGAGLRLRKAVAELRATPADEPPIHSCAQVLLNDITPNGMLLFCDYELAIGEFVQITMSEPRRVYVRGRISACHEITSESRV